MLCALTSCNREEFNESADIGLGIKVFFPTKVVTNQPMTINGSGFREVTEIVFPEGVSVKNFEIVSDGMIRVNAPAGISAEGGKIIVRTESEEAQSEEDLTVGKTVISGYSSQAGETLTGRDNLTIYGTDLEFINAVEFVDSEGNPIRVGQEKFYRKGTSTVIITIPDDVLDGAYIAKVYTYDGQTFDMPEFIYAHYEGGGHWETVKTILWENNGTPIPSWGGTFRFCNVEHMTGEEIYAFPMEDWALIKDGVVRVAVDVNDASNIRITTGWWSAAYGGTDHNCIDFVQEDEDGTKYIELNIKEDGNIYEMIDEQHLLFTGDAYTILYFYTVEQQWIEGEGGHWERKSLWKNEDGTAVPSWGGTFRFCNVEHMTGEEIYAFPMEDWALIKDGVVRVAVDVNDASNIRITTGWWSAAYGGTEHNCIDMIQEEEDGTKYIELNIKEDGNIYEMIDEQHLLFTGDAYTILEIYINEWVEGGGAPKPVIMWENTDGTPIPGWGGTFRFCNVETVSGEEIYAFPMEDWNRIKEGKVRAAVDANEGSNIRITTGWWSAAYGGTEHNCIDMIQEEEDGTKYIELNIKEDGNIYDMIDQQHLLFTGDAYTLLKIYYYE